MKGLSRYKTNGAAGSIGVEVLVVNPSVFARTCTVAGLETAPGLSVAACDTISGCDRSAPPSLILFQTAERRFLGSALAGQFALALRRWPGVPALVIADFADTAEMIATVQAGARGLLPSSASVEIMRSAIQLLVAGLAVHSVSLTSVLHAPAGAAQPSLPPPVRREDTNSRLTSLTKRQREVLRLLAQGLSNKTIAQHLRISESTVKVHIRAMMAQTSVSNRTQLVAFFLTSNGSDT